VRHVVRDVAAPVGAEVGASRITVTGPRADGLAAALRARGADAAAGAAEGDAGTLVVLCEDARACFEQARANAGAASRFVAIALGDAVTAGGIAGVAKTVGAETGRPALAIAGAADLDRIAAEILRERGVQEVVLDADGATTRVEVAASVAAIGPAPVGPGDLVVISGGARGVTAAVARELAVRSRPSQLDD
jgi:hypothetical protein